LEHPKDCISSDFERGFWKEKVVCTFFPHFLTPEQREDQVTSCQDITAMPEADKNFFNKIISKLRPGVLPMAPKQSDRILNG
jgi:hypothetical protein